MRVYEDFMRIPHGVVGAASNEAARPLLPRQEIRTAQGGQPESVTPESSVIPLTQIAEKAQGLVADLNRFLQENANVPLQSLNAQHPVKQAVQQLFWLISQSGNPDESCLIFSEKIIGFLFLSESLLAREVYVLVLRRLADFSKPLANELADWFMYNTDAQKYNVDVIIAIMRADIITCIEVDLHTSRQLENDSNIEFALELLSKCCLGETPLYSYADFLYTYECLRRMPSQSNK